MSAPGSRRGPAVLATAALLLGATACTADSEAGEPVEPYAVELAPEGLPPDVRIGVVVSLTGAPDQGTQWREAAEGAAVAAYRYGLGGADVTLLARDDRGTRRGAQAAVQELVDEGVAGIVMATEGAHTDGGIQRAAAAGVPLVLPYHDGTGELPDGVWTTGPDEDRVGAVLADAMDRAGVTDPVLVDAGGGRPPGVSSDSVITYTPGEDARRIGVELARRVRDGSGPDAVVVSGPAQLQATVLQSLQAGNVDVPVFATADALSPVFATTLSDVGGSLSAPVTSAGIDHGDVLALDPGQDGAAVSAWLASVRATAEDPETTDFFDGQPFDTVAGAADARSHDAVVALVAAAAAARSAEPDQVLAALPEVTVDHADGIAGPALSFAEPQALPADAVVPLQATAQDPGLRTVDPTGPPRLFWFAVPGS